MKTLPVLITCVALAGCASTHVQVTGGNAEAVTRKPSRLVVEDIPAPLANVSPGSGAVNASLRKARGITKEEAAQKVATRTSRAFADELAKTLGRKGIATTRAGADHKPQNREALLAGRFIAIEEGSETKRIVLGFGAGASQVQAVVKLCASQGGKVVVLREFTVRAKSAPTPGAAATVGLGPLATGSSLVASAVMSGASGVITDVTQTAEVDARRAARKLAGEIVAFYRARGWA
jgi:uncharacterized protein YceK